MSKILLGAFSTLGAFMIGLTFDQGMKGFTIGTGIALVAICTRFQNEYVD